MERKQALEKNQALLLEILYAKLGKKQVAVETLQEQVNILVAENRELKIKIKELEGDGNTESDKESD